MKRCEDCKYFFYESVEVYGDCRRYPPGIAYNDLKLQIDMCDSSEFDYSKDYEYPRVLCDNHCCGEFKPKEQSNKEVVR